MFRGAKGYCVPEFGVVDRETMWKIKRVVDEELINTEFIAVNNSHDIFLLGENGLSWIKDTQIEVIKHTASILSNIAVIKNDIYCRYREEILLIDAKSGEWHPFANCISEDTYVTLDDQNRLYTFEGDDCDEILRVDDGHTVILDKTSKHGFVVHQNILYAPLGKSIIKLDLETQVMEELPIQFQDQPFKSLSFIAVDHTEHKLYVIDHKQKSVYQIGLSEPYPASLIHRSLNREKRKEGPSYLAALDGRVYMLDCVFFGTENFYELVVLTERIGWNKQRLLWIAIMKCDPRDCKMAMLPKDIIKLIIKIIQD